jgi:hypothetical protein
MIPEMFHVKHFGPIVGKNLTTPRTAAPLRQSKTGQNFGAMGEGLQRRFYGLGRCSKIFRV